MTNQAHSILLCLKSRGKKIAISHPLTVINAVQEKQLQPSIKISFHQYHIIWKTGKESHHTTVDSKTILIYQTLYHFFSDLTRQFSARFSAHALSEMLLAVCQQDWLVSGFSFTLFTYTSFQSVYGAFASKELFILSFKADEANVSVMEKLFEKIGDHFNNPEMSDRILVVKIRKDGWEKLEAARRVRSITKTNSQEGNDAISGTNFNQKERLHVSTDKESIVSTSEPKCDTESAGRGDDSVNSASELRTVSSLSCDSGISDVTFSETKKTVKSKKIEESSIRGEKGHNPVNQDSGNWQNAANSNGDAVVSPTSSDVDVTISKLLIADISYTHKAGAIGLTALNTGDESPSASAPLQSSKTGTAEASVEYLTFTDTVIREQQLYVHSFWLALNSSYFRSLFFSSGMKETKVKKV